MRHNKSMRINWRAKSQVKRVSCYSLHLIQHGWCHVVVWREGLGIFLSLGATWKGLVVVELLTDGGID